MSIDRIKTLANAYLLALAEQEHGIPSGHLYALVAMPLGAHLDEHNAAVAALTRIGIVKEACHLLTWAGPDDLRKTLVDATRDERT